MSGYSYWHQNVSRGVGEAAYNSDQFVQQWSGKRSEPHVPQVDKIVESVKKEAEKFDHALQQSISTADAGWSLCTKGERFCDALLDPYKSDKDLKDMMRVMCRIAREGHDSAQSVLESFRSARVRLYKVFPGIPHAAAEIEDARQLVHNQSDNAGRYRDYSDVGASVGIAGSAVSSAVHLFTSVPRAVLILPTVLPVLALVGQGLKVAFSRRVARLEKEERGFNMALDELKHIQSDLKDFATQLDVLVEWWASMDTNFHALKRNVYSLRTGLGRTRIEATKQNWTDAKSMYMTYYTQDHSPRYSRALTASSTGYTTNAIPTYSADSHLLYSNNPPRLEWEERYTPEGQKYFFNNNTRVSTWHDPLVMYY